MRSPYFLAALASRAVTGLDPTAVQGLVPRPGDEFEIAYLQDAQDRRWVIKAPLTQAAGALLDDVSTLYGLLGRRLDVAVPQVRGSIPVPEGRAVVYLRSPGTPIMFASMPPGPLAAEIGRTLAHVHNLERGLFDEAGRISYDAATHRARLLSDLDRAAASGHVPTGLLSRWEAVLDDVSLWRFATVPVHGRFVGENVLVSFEDDTDASTGRVRAVLAWEDARVTDPAEDFAALVAQCSPEALDSVTEAYLNSRVERADRWLMTRARLAAELRHVSRLLTALSAGQGELVDKAAAALRALDERVWDEDPLHVPSVPGSLPREDPNPVDAVDADRAVDAAEPVASGPAVSAVPEPEPEATQGIAMEALLADDEIEVEIERNDAHADSEAASDPDSDAGSHAGSDSESDTAVLDTGEGASEFVALPPSDRRVADEPDEKRDEEPGQEH